MQIQVQNISNNIDNPPSQLQKLKSLIEDLNKVQVKLITLMEKDFKRDALDRQIIPNSIKTEAELKSFIRNSVEIFQTFPIESDENNKQVSYISNLDKRLRTYVIRHYLSLLFKLTNINDDELLELFTYYVVFNLSTFLVNFEKYLLLHLSSSARKEKANSKNKAVKSATDPHKYMPKDQYCNYLMQIYSIIEIILGVESTEQLFHKNALSEFLLLTDNSFFKINKIKTSQSALFITENICEKDFKLPSWYIKALEFYNLLFLLPYFDIQKWHKRFSDIAKDYSWGKYREMFLKLRR